MARAAESRQETRWKNRVIENDIVVERSVPKKHIEKLAGILANRRRGKIDTDTKPAAALIFDRRHLTNDVG